jgi:hypothetical protein
MTAALLVDKGAINAQFAVYFPLGGHRVNLKAVPLPDDLPTPRPAPSS